MKIILLDQELQTAVKDFLLNQIRGEDSTKGFEAVALYREILSVLKDLIKVEEGYDPDSLPEGMARILAAAEGEVHRREQT